MNLPVPQKKFIISRREPNRDFLHKGVLLFSELFLCLHFLENIQLKIILKSLRPILGGIFYYPSPSSRIVMHQVGVNGELRKGDIKTWKSSSCPGLWFSGLRISYLMFHSIPAFASEKTDAQSMGMIAGAVTGMVAGALLIFLLVWLLIRKKDKERYEEEERPNEIR